MRTHWVSQECRYRLFARKQDDARSELPASAEALTRRRREIVWSVFILRPAYLDAHE
jgi:hypothetical protein